MKADKPKIWSLKKADEEFSRWIRKRDGRCVRPKCGKLNYLQCSHFWSRVHMGTRFDPLNCDTLDAGCHLYHYEIEKQGEYRDFKVAQLGEQGYEDLRRRAQAYKSREEAIRDCMKLLGAL